MDSGTLFRATDCAAASWVPKNCGLQNLGNQCYMNSALQCLLHTTELSNFFLRGFYRRYLNEGFGSELVYEFSFLVEEMHRLGNLAATDSASAVNPSSLKVCIGKIDGQFKNHTQEDSQELLMSVLNRLHEGLNQANAPPRSPSKFEFGSGDPRDLADMNWNKYKATDDSFIKSTFRGQLSRTSKCLGCDSISVAWDPFDCLSISFSEHDKPTTCLAEMLHSGLFQKEQPDQKMCVTCGTQQNFTTQLGIWRAPDIIILQLKRFKTVTGPEGNISQVRIDTMVDVPGGQVDFGPYFDTNSPFRGSSQSTNTYRLYAISNHIGDT
jgi:ubiquitin carboxyl-terminal hydrolase 2/21